MEWLSDDEDGQWQCDFCIENKLQEVRNCEGIEGHSFALRVYDRVFTRCPLMSLDAEAVSDAQFVLLCEGGGMSVSRILPSQMLKETAYYFNVRSIILGEQRRIEKIRERSRKKD